MSNINQLILESIIKNNIYGSHLIKDFNLNINDYFIVASGAMVAHGLMNHNDDLDMVILPDKFNQLVKNGLLIEQKKYNGQLITYKDKTGTIDCSSHLIIGNKSNKWWFNHTEIINGLRVLTIEGLKYFYTELYKKYHKEKHKQKLDILNNL